MVTEPRSITVPIVTEVVTAGWDVRNIVERFVWTAVQAFVGSLPATLALTTDALVATGYAGLTAAVAAVISLAKNLTGEGVAVQAAKRAIAQEG